MVADRSLEKQDRLLSGVVLLLLGAAGTESLGPTVGLWMGGSVLLNGATAIPASVVNPFVKTIGLGTDHRPYEPATDGVKGICQPDYTSVSRTCDLRIPSLSIRN